MKKRLAICMALCMALVLVACGGTASSPDAGGSAPAESDAGTSAGGGEHSLVFMTTTLGDMGFFDAAWEGIQALSAQHGYSCEAIEMGADPSAYEAAFLDAIDSGKYDVFYGATSGGMGDYMVKYSVEFPDYKFILFDAGRDLEIPSDNFAAITYLQNEGAYLGGVMAALLSKSGQLGLYLHMDSPILNDFATGFYQGASDVNPDIKIYSAYGAGVSGDSARSAELTAVMLNAGADVIFGAAGSSNPGLFQNILDRGGFEAGYYAIGVDYDQWYKYTNSDSPEMAQAVVSSVVKKVDESLIEVWNGLLDGSLSWGELFFFGIQENSVGLAKNEYYEASVPADIRAQVDEYEERVRGGEIVVKSYFDFADHDAFLSYQAETAA